MGSYLEGAYPDCAGCHGDGGRWDPVISDQWYSCWACWERFQEHERDRVAALSCEQIASMYNETADD